MNTGQESHREREARTPREVLVAHEDDEPLVARGAPPLELFDRDRAEIADQDDARQLGHGALALGAAGEAVAEVEEAGAQGTPRASRVTAASAAKRLFG